MKSLIESMNGDKVRISSLPANVRKAIDSVGFKGRFAFLYRKDKFSLYNPGGDGERGFAIVVHPDGGADVSIGAWGGGSLGGTQSPVDTDQTNRPIPEGAWVVKGTQGGLVPIAFVYASAETIGSLS